MEVSIKGNAIQPSVTLEISARAKALKAEGKSIVAFTAGEPDFNTPEFIINSAKRALDEGKTKYTPASGIAELKKAIAEKFKKDNGLIYEPSNIVVSDGAKSSLFHAFASILNEGDEVILVAPYWITYVEQIKFLGGKCVVVNTSEKSGYKLTKADLESAITDKTKCLLLNSPCNPTGVVYTKEELKDIAEVVEKYGLKVVSDEVYEKLVFDGAEHISIATISEYMKNNTIVVNGVSKTFSMTGWRIGYLGAPTEIAKAISNLQSHTTSNPCSFAQYASVDALSSIEGETFCNEMRDEFAKRRDKICSMLDKFGYKYIKPMGAFYVFMNIEEFIGKKYKGEEIKGSVSFANALLSEGVAVIPGLAFGADNFVRLAYAVSEEDIALGIERIKAFENLLK